MSHFNKLAFTIPLLCFASFACGAAELNGQQVMEVGTHADMDLAFFRVTGDLSQCNYTSVYIPLSTNAGRAAFATVLAARNSKTPLGRVAYSRAADGTCTLTLVSE